jgi:hypothetical protein
MTDGESFRHWVIDWSGDDLAHRMDPTNAVKALCGHDWVEIFWEDDWPPANYPSCGRCDIAVGRARGAIKSRNPTPAQSKKTPAVASPFSAVKTSLAKARPPKPRKRAAESARRDVNDAFQGGRFSEDPDATRRLVWIFKTGASFHRRDCQVVESRDGAFAVPVSDAQSRKLIRCMHCAPTVR